MKRARDDDDIIAVALFGSHARGEPSGISDLDICVFLKPRRYHSLEMHQKRISCLESAASDKVDIQIFQQLPVPIRSQILKEGRMILVKDEDALYELAHETIKDLEDFRKHYSEYLVGVAHAAGEG